MALRVIDHYPNINDVDVYRNIHVKAQFNKAINPQSLDYSHFSVHEKNTYTTVPGELGIEYNTSGQAVYAVFQPLINFTANTKYQVYLHKAPNSVISSDNEQLESTYSWEFTTGADILSGNMPVGIPSGSLPASGIPTVTGVISGVYIPASSGITTFSVTETSPQHQEPNVPSGLGASSGVDPIVVIFNLQVDTPLSDLSGYVTITERDVLA